MGKFSETDLAERVVRFFEESETYKEQMLPNGRCDIVVKSGALITAVECKSTFNFEVVRQALSHKKYSNYTFVAVPAPNKRTAYYPQECICKELGIGILYVKMETIILGKSYDSIGVSIGYQAPYQRRVGVINLEEKQKYAVAGAQNNSQSDFKVTVRLIEETIKRKGSITIDELFKDHWFHWSSTQSARQCFVRYVNKRILKQFEIKKGVVTINH